MYPLTVYNHMDAVTMCCYGDPDLLNILESDKLRFFFVTLVIIIIFFLHFVNTTPASCITTKCFGNPLDSYLSVRLATYDTK